MEIARVILYLFVTFVVCPIIITPVIIGSIVGASFCGLFQVICERLRRKDANLRAIAPRLLCGDAEAARYAQVSPAVDEGSP